MEERYEQFYKYNWERVYGFWHKTITRGEHQVKILIDLLNKIDKSTINILDVGSGSGDEIQEVLSSIKDKDLYIVANDTSKEALDAYTKNNGKNVKEFIEGRLENLPKKTVNKFDLILMSHCLYSVNLKGLFNEYLNLLSENGKILIFLDSKKSTIKQIQNKFWNDIYHIPFDENTAEDIFDELHNQNLKFESKDFVNYMDLERLYKLDKDGISNLLIPFSFRTFNINQKLKDQIVSYIKKLEEDQKLQNHTYMIIIKK